jgi:uncharacterized protein (DUF2062 family)
MFRKLLRLPRYYLLRVKRLKGDPEYLARGFAFGVFMGVLPLVPVQTIILVPLTILFRVSTITAIVAGTLVSNPLTFMPQYYLTWKIGNAILPGEVSWEQLDKVLHEVARFMAEESMLRGITSSVTAISRLGLNTIAVLLTGGAIIGIPAGLISYCFARKFFHAVHERRRKRQRPLLDRPQKSNTL